MQQTVCLSILSEIIEKMISKRLAFMIITQLLKYAYYTMQIHFISIINLYFCGWVLIKKLSETTIIQIFFLNY